MATATRNSARLAANASKANDKADTPAPAPKSTKSNKPKGGTALDKAVRDAKRQDITDAEATRVARDKLRKSLVLCCARVFSGLLTTRPAPTGNRAAKDAALAKGG